jgi:hypothetical protein
MKALWNAAWLLHFVVPLLLCTASGCLLSGHTNRNKIRLHDEINDAAATSDSFCSLIEQLERRNIGYYIDFERSHIQFLEPISSHRFGWSEFDCQAYFEGTEITHIQRSIVNTGL